MHITVHNRRTQRSTKQFHDLPCYPPHSHHCSDVVYRVAPDCHHCSYVVYRVALLKPVTSNATVNAFIVCLTGVYSELST